MATYTITPLKMGEFLTHEKSTLTYFDGYGIKLRTPITMWLVRGEGKTIIVDTGLGDQAWCAKYHHPIHWMPEMHPLAALAREGLEPADVDFVINTHLHWDHCFNNDLFASKRIYVQKTELAFAADATPPQYQYYECEQIGMIPSYKRAWDALTPVDGDTELCPGIRLILIPSHTPGSQGVLVDTTAGTYLIAGDAIGTYENWEGRPDYCHGTLPGQRIMPAIHVNLADCYRSYEKIEKLADFVLPGHDMRVYDNACYPYCGMRHIKEAEMP